MKILLSAYACEPNKGSEPGVGWNWAQYLAKAGHNVVVLTRANNANSINNNLPSCNPRSRFVFYDLPSIFLKLKRAGVLSTQLYYILWQIAIVRIAMQLVKEEQFDVAWHLTFASIRSPSLLWTLKCPLVLGPVGGGERAPFAMRSDFGLMDHVKELFRDLLIAGVRLDPLCRILFRRAKIIFVTTPASRQCIPKKMREKSICLMAIGIDDVADTSHELRRRARKFLFVGRFIYWKGVTLAIRAFAEFSRLGGVGQLTLVGEGPAAARAQAIAEELQVEHLIEWIPWTDHRDLGRLYNDHDILLFPSLHDSSGLVVVEAMAHALPVVCLDLGGPAQIVKNGGGAVVSTAGRSSKTVATALGCELKRLSSDVFEFTRLSHEARERAREYFWSVRVQRAIVVVQRTVEKAASVQECQ